MSLKTIKEGPLLLLARRYRFAGDDHCNPALPTLAGESGTSEDKIGKWLKALEKHGSAHETLGLVEAYDFSRISVTALGPALARGEYTDIPWAKEVLACLRMKGSILTEGQWSNRVAHDYAPFLESRFKAVNRILETQGAAQILELAAGLSPRGMDFARGDVVYVEADLAESIALKREVVTAVLGQVPANLILCAASVLNRSELAVCCSEFTHRPVAITTEGLLRYLTFEEKTQLAANVREILSRYGGIWITTDIHLRQWSQRYRGPINRETETERLGRDLDPNYFDDLDHARTFFEGCGFQVESRPLLEGIRDHVISWPQASDDLVSELNNRRTFILRLSA
jgi:O-methyltransferase involved in polyketide biosynthesis